MVTEFSAGKRACGTKRLAGKSQKGWAGVAMSHLACRELSPVYIYIYCCIFNIWMIARRPSLLGSTSELAMEVVVSPVLCEELSAAPDFPGASWHRLIQKCVKTTSVKLVNTSCLSKHRVIRSLENHEHQNSRCALSKFLWGNWRACQGFSNQSFVL